MLKYGLEYDHSFSHHDCQCYWLRTGDKWTPIDLKKSADHWMKPLEPGPTTGLVEIPASWYLDGLCQRSPTVTLYADRSCDRLASDDVYQSFAQ